MTCRVTCLVVMVMICLTATAPAIAKIANRCDEPVFGAASIAIDKIAATAAEARQTGVDAAAQILKPAPAQADVHTGAADMLDGQSKLVDELRDAFCRRRAAELRARRAR